MPRLISVAHTEAQVVAGTKVATRRLNWWTDKNGRRLVLPGDTLTCCRKIMGRKPDEPLVRIRDVQVEDVARAQLRVQFTDHDAADEGFPDWTYDEFVAFYCDTFKVTPETVITYIRWRYLTEGEA